jgi:four helix bundle protein
MSQTMNQEDMKRRTKDFALRIIRLVAALPRNVVADVIGRQLVRSGTSVAANYRAACRAKSRADFVAKMGTVEEEADETAFWIDILAEAGLVPRPKLDALLKEADEITAIVVASIRTTRLRTTARQEPANPQSAIRDPQSP